MMEFPGHMGDERVAASGREVAIEHWREERWRRVRSLRLKSWFFSLLWPLVVLIVFAGSEIGVYSLVQLLPGLNQHAAAVYGFAAQIVTCMVFVAAGVYVILSPRNDTWIRRWGRRGIWRLSGKPKPKVQFHARYCAARNRGTAAIFLGYCLLELSYAWRNLSKPLPSQRPSMIIIEALLITMVTLVCLFVSLTCFRERLALGMGVAAYVSGLAARAVPALAAPYSPAIRELCLFIWAAAAITSLGLLKSALRAPPPDFRRS